MNNQIILALDCNSKQAIKLVDYFDKDIQFYKVGMPLFLKCGWEIIKFLHYRNKTVLFDLNICEIPSVAVKIMKEVMKHKVEYVTVNLLGGMEMVKAIKDVNQDEVQIIGNTLNSSMNNTLVKQIIHLKYDIQEQIDKLVYASKSVGIDGIICAPQDNLKIKKHDIDIYNVGIRYKAKANDHRRMTTPKKAFETGASFIIIGREIYESAQPYVTFQEILTSLK